MKSAPTYPEPTHEEIALSAFLTWEREGRQPGHEMSYWLRAEAEIRAFRQKKAEAAAQNAARWPIQSATTRSRTVKSRTTPGAESKSKPAAGQKLKTKSGRENGHKPAISTRAVSVRRTALKAAR